MIIIIIIIINNMDNNSNKNIKLNIKNRYTLINKKV